MYMAGIAASTAHGISPYVLPSTLDPSLGLTVYNSAAPPHALEVGLAWFIPALILAIVYLFVAYRSFQVKSPSRRKATKVLSVRSAPRSL